MEYSLGLKTTEGKIIAVASGKGGTGKTTAVAALSSCLAMLGNKTLCIDFDVGMRNLDLSLGMTDFAVMDFMDVVSGKIELMSAVSESPAIPNLFFLTAPPEDLLAVSGDEPSAFEYEHSTDITEIRAMFNEVRKNFDYCLVDSPPGIGTYFELAHCDADMSIIITTGENPSIRDAEQTATAVRSLNIENLRLLVNRVTSGNFKHIRSTVDDVIDTIGVQLLGLIPEDKYIFRALHSGVPLILYKKRRSAFDFLDVARRIAGEDIPLQRF